MYNLWPFSLSPESLLSDDLRPFDQVQIQYEFSGNRDPGRWFHDVDDLLEEVASREAVTGVGTEASREYLAVVDTLSTVTARVERPVIYPGKGTTQTASRASTSSICVGTSSYTARVNL